MQGHPTRMDLSRPWRYADFFVRRYAATIIDSFAVIEPKQLARNQRGAATTPGFLSALRPLPPRDVDGS